MKRKKVTSWYVYQVTDPKTGTPVAVRKEQGLAPANGSYSLALANGASRILRREILAYGLSEPAATRLQLRLEGVLFDTGPGSAE